MLNSIILFVKIFLKGSIMKTKFFFLIAILFALAGLEHAKTQEPIDLEIVWQKEVFPKDIKFAKFSANGYWIYIATNDSTIEKISAETGEFISVFDNQGLVKSNIETMEMSESGNYIVTSDGKGTVVIWDVKLERAIKKLDYQTTVVDISPTEQFVIMCVMKGVNTYHPIIYDFINDIELKELKYDHIINKIKLSHNGQYFATGGFYSYNDGAGEKYYDQVILWSTETWAPVDTIETLGGVGSGYKVIKFSKDDKYLGCVRRTPADARIYELESNNIIKNAGIGCYSIEILPDNYHFLLFYATSSEIYSLELHDISQKIKSYQIPTGIIDVYDENNKWKIICCIGNYPMTLLTKKIVGIQEQLSANEQFNISSIGNQILVEAININSALFNIEIYNLQGNLIYSELLEHNSSNSKYNLDLKLSTGIYIVKVKSGSQEYSQKIKIVR